MCAIVVVASSLSFAAMLVDGGGNGGAGGDGADVLDNAVLRERTAYQFVCALRFFREEWPTPQRTWLCWLTRVRMVNFPSCLIEGTMAQARPVLLRAGCMTPQE